MTGLGAGIPWQLADGQPAYYAGVAFLLDCAWWMNWKYDCYGHIYRPYVPMLWAMRADGAAGEAMRLSAGGHKLWLVGNEPERADQSNTPPDDAAKFSVVWAGVTDVAWAGPGVLLGLEAAYTWLDAYLVAGGIVPNYWAVHNYAWNEVQWGDFLEQFKAWMRKRRVERPIMVTETACWGPYLGDQMKVMDAAAGALERGEIEAACWYAAKDPFGVLSAADLLTESGSLTELGEHFRQHSAPPVSAGENVQVHLPLIMRESVALG